MLKFQYLIAESIDRNTLATPPNSGRFFAVHQISSTSRKQTVASLFCFHNNALNKIV
jgi:hypothetical protein